MTNEELRNLYKTCIYCDLDMETEAELCDWECKTIYFPIMDEMLKDGCSKEELGNFAEACFFDYYMTPKTIVNLNKKYGFERINSDHLDSKLFKYYEKVREYNK